MRLNFGKKVNNAGAIVAYESVYFPEFLAAVLFHPKSLRALNFADIYFRGFRGLLDKI